MRVMYVIIYASHTFVINKLTLNQCVVNMGLCVSMKLPGDQNVAVILGAWQDAKRTGQQSMRYIQMAEGGRPERIKGEMCV